MRLLSSKGYVDFFRARILAVFGAMLVFCRGGLAATVGGSVDWQALTGPNATALHYGLSAFHGFNPSVAGSPGSSAYKNNVAYMRPGIIRYHHADQVLASSIARGWVLSPDTANYAWDTNKINNALSGAYSYGPVIMMCIVRWPAYLNASASDQRLAVAHYTDFANFCADLVRIVNIRQHRGILYWEITNELESKGYWNSMDEVARIYHLAATAMKAVDPTIKVGGPAFGSPENRTHLTQFLSTTRALNSPLDFVTYHQYPDYQDKNFTASDATLWNQASAIGSITAGVRDAVTTFYSSTNGIELFQDEYNINWTWKSGQTPPSELRMRDMKGAIWDALAMISMVNAQVSGAMAWNEADLAFGKLNTDWSYRPAAHIYHEFNLDMTGEVVATASSDSSKLVLFAQRSGTRRKLAMINRSGIDQTLRLSFAGWNSSLFATQQLTLKRASALGLVTESVAYSTLTNQSGLSLPADTIAFLVVDENTLAAPAPGNLSATGGEAQVVLKWNPSSRATSYTVKCSSASGGPYTNVMSGLSSTAFVHAGLPPGCVLYYAVSAINPAGESALSAEVAVSILAPRLDLSVLSNTLTLAWSASASNYPLSRATNLATGNWTRVTNLPVVTSGVLRLPLVPDAPRQYFRLDKP